MYVLINLCIRYFTYRYYYWSCRWKYSWKYIADTYHHCYCCAQEKEGTNCSIELSFPYVYVSILWQSSYKQGWCSQLASQQNTSDKENHTHTCIVINMIGIPVGGIFNAKLKICITPACVAHYHYITQHS